MEGLRVSHVAPAVEENIGKLNELVKQLGSGDLTESQNRRMVAYLGNIDEMRQQLVIMVQRYENDERVLRRLLELVDRIDDVKSVVAAGGTQSDAEEEIGPGADDLDELTRQIYDSPLNPLMVSQKDVLGVSGLADDGAYAASMAYVEEQGLSEEERDPWDQVDDPDLLRESITFEDPSLDLELLDINLTVSSVGLPTIIHPLMFPAPPPPPPLPTISGPSSHTRRAPLRAAGHRHTAASSSRRANESDEDSGSESSTSDSDAERPWRRGTPTFGAHRPHTGSIIHPAAVEPRAPPPPPAPVGGKGKRRVFGACTPVTCKICYDEYNKHEDIYEFDGCAHTYCRECLRGYLRHNIGEGAVLDLMCPCPECETEVTIEDIRFLCDYDDVAKYERFVVIASLKADPNTRWCPAPNCVNGIKVEGTPKWVHCNLCEYDFCFACLSAKHEGTDCSKAVLQALAARKEAEEKALELFKEWAEQHRTRVKPCPLCHTFIEKTEGCNHMTCANISCRHQFCWLCLGDYDNGTHFNDFENIPNCFDKQFYTAGNDVLEYNPAAFIPPRRGFGRIAKKVGIYVGVGMAVVTLGVPAAVIGGPIYGCFQLHKRLKAKRRARIYYNPDFTPPTAERINEARREAERLRALEREAFPQNRY